MIVSVTPFKAKFTDKENVSKLSVRIIGDDLANSCNLYWALLTDEDEVKAEGNHSFSGEKYAQWDGGNDYLLTLLLEELPISIHNDQN
jgi:hypothetical protein